ncbi:dihydrodipicolinate synthase family protein [Micromonospora coxensis]|uniref:4-hydroxy-tetrahydrodipicolinate synthase n=1 Tax=Micromonospora coxensis TaxID=356852 RepID=A0A1C5K2G5_9ACTN|nr:dihydrodipicolinate synthase family protein [Micromonospora coxensis]SCG76719.1 4-hydroxy-tetrahydrodipicolinate synthase [Micromonospora coxensis]
MTFPVTGLVPILATPFAPDGALAVDDLHRLLEFQLACGVDGIALFGFASETFALSARDREQILDAVDTVVGRAVPVVVGVNATGLPAAVEQARQAAERGAAGLMVLPPYMVKPSPTQLIDFYGTLAAQVPVPVMVQDAPNMTGVQMPVPLLAELAALPGVDAVKVEAPPTAPKCGAVGRAAPGFAVFGGQNALFLLEEYARGAVGTMPACEFADALRPVLDDWSKGLRDDARQGFNRLLPLIRYGLQPGLAWAIHKHVLVRRGVIATATVRAPAQPIDDVTVAELDAILAVTGL